MARGVIKTGLGEHLAYHFISILGKKTLGIAYSIAFCETILAPVTPSNTARAGAIINPIVQVIARSFKSTPEDGTQNKIGTYLSLVNYQEPILFHHTATAPNPLVLYFLSPLEIKSTPNASTFAKDKLKELVKMKNSEKIMLSVFVSLLLLWAGALGLFFWNFS
ncbi:TPA: anion permease [Campylobacter jejuni]|uniref:anion permease n=1 Tax=Campylobacter TaxID=194 RepID=UPI00190014D6|nr:anion permease [Campylobacter jejuni]EKN2135713.1 anion permease [Campylobacter jejuni]MDV6123113.1 anion permease [Campylobacter jejuni]WPM70225.1 anion permease [Campylobacter sp. CFSAN122719]